MEMARAVYSPELKKNAMRAWDAGATQAEVARQYQVSPKLLEKWRLEWRAKGEAAFPGHGRHSPGPTPEETRQIEQLQRKIGELTMENEFLKKVLQDFRERPPASASSGASGSTGKLAEPLRQEGK